MISPLRLLLRDLRGRPLRLLLLSVVIAVASLASLGLLTERIENSMSRSAQERLAADVRLDSSLPLDAQHWQPLLAQATGHAQLLFYDAMVFGEDDLSLLASVKAVSEQYPLHGRLRIAEQPGGQTRWVEHGPPPGEAWVSARLLDTLGVATGASLLVGEKTFRVTQVLESEPDSPVGFFGVSPRVMVNLADVPPEVLAEGSRVKFDWLVSLPGTANIPQLREQFAERLGPHTRWRDTTQDDTRAQRQLGNVRQFLMLASALCVLLAGVAMAMAAQDYSREQHKTIALLKTLGLGPGRITRLYGLFFGVITGLALLAGALLGWAGQGVFAASLRELFAQDLAAASAWPTLFAFVAGGVLFVGFAGVPLWQLRRVPPASLLREQQAPSKAVVWPGFLLVLLLVAGFSRDWQLSLALALAITLVFVAVALGLERLLKVLTLLRWPAALRPGIEALARHRHSNRLPLAVFALLFIPLLVLLQVRSRILETWQAQLPEFTPNYFLFNIAEADKDPIAQWLSSRSPKMSPFYPMTRGRLVSLESAVPEARLVQFKENLERYQRELQMTWSRQLSADNRVTQGRWWTEQVPAQEPLAVSLEEGFAQNMGLEVGDRLQISIAGAPVSAQVASLRSVQWDALTPNFFVIFNRQPHEAVSADWIASFYLGKEHQRQLSQLIRQHPQLSLIELDSTLASVKTLLSQLSSAIEMVFWCLVLAGVAVLLTALQASLRIRLKEAAILRVCGASQGYLRRSLLGEFFALGVIAALLALAVAEGLIAVLQVFWLKIDYQWAWLPWLLAPSMAGALIAGLGWWSCRRVVYEPATRVLRASV
jgi:putative ABC transport system permease protein